MPHIEAMTVPGPLRTVLDSEGSPYSVRSSRGSMPLAPLLMFTQATTSPEASGMPECAGVALKRSVPGATLRSWLLPTPSVLAAAMIVVIGPRLPQPKVGAA
ncbi:hypothetical protein CEQ30_36385 [Nocardia brasiliensis]|nr:hypothetical protein CEQ30_36385 [Nocardia brasiliensis]